MCCASWSRSWFLGLLAAAAVGMLLPGFAWAGIIQSGDVTPDASTWTDFSIGTWPTAYVGDTGNGSVTINGGSVVGAPVSGANQLTTVLGNQAGSFGTLTVTGTATGSASTFRTYNLTVGFPATAS